MTNVNKNPAFSFRRCALLVRNRLYDEAGSVGIGAAVMVGLNLLGLILSRRAWLNESGSDQAWSFAVILGGLLLASQAFKGMHDGKAGSEWLLLPASPLEKYAAAAADYLVIYPLVASAGAALASLLLSLLERALGGAGGTVWTPVLAGGFRAWGEYAIAATILMRVRIAAHTGPIRYSANSLELLKNETLKEVIAIESDSTPADALSASLNIFLSIDRVIQDCFGPELRVADNKVRQYSICVEGQPWPPAFRPTTWAR